MPLGPQLESYWKGTPGNWLRPALARGSLSDPVVKGKSHLHTLRALSGRDDLPKAGSGGIPKEADKVLWLGLGGDV